MAEKTLIRELDNGLKIFDAREDGKEVIVYEQDVEPTVNFTQSLAKDGDYTKMGIKESMWHYATIPDNVILKLWFEHGLNVYAPMEPAQERKFWALLNDEFSVFKTTEKHHSV